MAWRWFPLGRCLIAESNSAVSARASFTRHFFDDIRIVGGIGCCPRPRGIPLIRKGCLLDTTSKLPYSGSESDGVGADKAWRKVDATRARTRRFM
jgi:hypothetical protein